MTVKEYIQTKKTFFLLLGKKPLFSISKRDQVKSEKWNTKQ